MTTTTGSTTNTLCIHCGASLAPPFKFCNQCGRRPGEPPVYDAEYVDEPPRAQAHSGNHQQVAARGFADVFGLHMAVAFFVVAANLMVGGLDAGGIIGLFSRQLGFTFWDVVLAFALSFVLASLLGPFTYFAQRHWCGDSPQSARLRAFIVFTLSVIPMALPGVLFGGVALIGALVRRKKD